MACVLFAAICAFITSPGDAAERGELTVTETAGIRRFVYPVQVELDWPEPLPEDTRFRLLHEGQPLPAQFGVLSVDEFSTSKVSLDFDASFLPWEERTYEIEYGSDVTPSDEPPPGMHVEEHDDHYLVTHTKYLAWKIPKDLHGFLETVKTPELEFMRPESAGFFVTLHDSEALSIGIENSSAQVTGSRIVKQGPIQCELEFDVAVKTDDKTIDSRIHLSLPRSKSWVEIDWTFDDSNDAVAACGIDLNLNVVDAPTLIDFGAGSYVYAPLSPQQTMVMKATRSTWQVLRGTPADLQPYVVQSDAFSAPAEGWAHVMDADRCTAISVADFGTETADMIQIDADGRTRLVRAEFPKKLETKSLKVWYHFVTMPMHVGAATSPQSMLYPLETEWMP